MSQELPQVEELILVYVFHCIRVEVFVHEAELEFLQRGTAASRPR